MQEIIEELAPVRTEFGREADPFRQWFVDIRGGDCESFDPLPDRMHHRIGENEAAPNDVDIYFPTGNANPQFDNIRCQVFRATWQALYVVDLELAHTYTGKKGAS